MFAKFFDPPEGQIVAMLREGDDGTEIRFFARPPGLDVCETALTFKDEKTAQATFDKLTQHEACKAVAPLYEAATHFA